MRCRVELGYQERPKGGVGLDLQSSRRSSLSDGMWGVRPLAVSSASWVLRRTRCKSRCYTSVSQSNYIRERGMTAIDMDRPRLTFHPEFLYKHQHRRTSVVLESVDGAHFHVPLDILTRYSTVFAAAASMPIPEFAHTKPISLCFASTWALLYALMTLRDCDKEEAIDSAHRTVTPDVVPAAARIAHILDIPIVAKVILTNQNLDVYLRYAIDHMFDDVKRDRIVKSSRTAATIDLSFSLYPLVERYRRAIDILMLANPSASPPIAEFYHRRHAALETLRKWWTTGEPVGRILRSDLPPKIVHKRRCKARKHTDETFRRHLSDIAALALSELSRAKTVGQRSKAVIGIVASQAAGCRGCLNKLEAIFMPALRVFNANFPASPG